jgi:cytochrome c oxidase subunit 5b
MKDPIVIKAWGEEQYVGCCGVPADTHNQIWMTISRERPIERCTECGNVIKMEYIGPEDPHRESKSFFFRSSPSIAGWMTSRGIPVC